jgi:UDP-3-O-[3-hydroxymyristoyl] glucosamine N-acyltransferase
VTVPLAASIPLAPRPIEALVERHGGSIRNGAKGVVRRLVPITRAAAGDLTVLLNARYVDDAIRASSRGALLLVEESIGGRPDVASLPGWFHPYAAWAMAELLDSGDAPADQPIIGSDCLIGPGVHLLSRVKIGSRVTIGAGAVIGSAGFGFVVGPDGKTREVPQLGGVVIDDDVHIGALCTIAAGTIGPTTLNVGVKIDAQVHIGHNCEIGRNTIIAAQTGLAGSVTVGKGVMIGGQVGIADHLTVGDGAKIAAKSGVIGDVPAGATVAGYPAVERQRWLRGLAELYRLAGGRGGASSSPSPEVVANAAFDPARVAATIPAPRDGAEPPVRGTGLREGTPSAAPRSGRIRRTDPPDGADGNG